MANYKRQHYVPRCYLKPFSHAQAGQAVHLLNISQMRAIANASVKGQCAKDYFYGKDLQLESALRDVEAAYASILRRVQFDPRSIADNDLFFLRWFAYLQFRRTDEAVRRARLAFLQLQQAIYQEGDPGYERFDLSDHALIRDTMRLCIDTSGYISDLKICIMYNRTKHDFVTSDDPSVFTNRFYFQRLRLSNFGIASSGALFFMPLSPRHLVMCYDGQIYTVQDKIGHYVALRSISDVASLNELQYIKAANNIYFADWNDRDRLIHAVDATKDRRSKSWSETSVLVPDGHIEGGERYRVATEEEGRIARRFLIGISSRFLSPSRWVSKLKLRNAPRTYWNGTAVGHVRRVEWLRR